MAFRTRELHIGRILLQKPPQITRILCVNSAPSAALRFTYLQDEIHRRAAEDAETAQRNPK